VIPDVATALAWAAQGQQRVETAAAALTDADARADSALPGWSRGHVLTHLARNADALVNLLTWARTGVPSPMYASSEHRTDDIDAGADRPAAVLLSDLHDAGRRFADAARAASPDDWRARVAGATGREFAASEVPWLRVREVWLHLVDLSVGVPIDDIPSDVAWHLVEDVAAWMSSRIDVAVELIADGRSPVRMGSGERVADLRGTANSIAGWLTGRTDVSQLASDGDPPPLPHWL
jgi:maleylpyruvate isomerase